MRQETTTADPLSYPIYTANLCGNPRCGKTPHKCPTCDGQGVISKPNHIDGDQKTWMSSGDITYPCPARCENGILWN